MLVTQVEIFIEHLVDAILYKEPRRLKDLAGEKQLAARELVDAQNYDAVMGLLREKVAKELLASSIREMLEKHLGERFKLFEKQSLTCTTLKETGEKEIWDISDIERVWRTRHEIVHEGRVDLQRNDFEHALFACTWVQTFLTVQAQAVYGLSVDGEASFNAVAGLFREEKQFVLFALYVGWVVSGSLGKLTVKRKY